MYEWTASRWQADWQEAQPPFAVFIHTPLCGTCAAARRMLSVTEQLAPDFAFAEANLNQIPDLAQQFQIESVPCLLFKRADGSWDKLYRFASVVDLAERLQAERSLLT